MKEVIVNRSSKWRMNAASGRMLAASVVALLAFAVAGCNPPASDTRDRLGKVIGGKSVNATANEKPRIIVIPRGPEDAFWKAARRGAEEAGKEFNAQIIWNEPPSMADVPWQKQSLSDAVNKKVDGVVLAPLDRTTLVRPVNLVAKARIPIVIIESDVDTNSKLSLVAPDHYQSGAIAAQRIGKISGGQGKIAMIAAESPTQDIGERERGFEDLMKQEFPQVDVEKSSGESLKTPNDILTNNSGIVALFSPDVSSTESTLQALRNHKLNGKVKIIGFDATASLLDALRSGDVDALLLQDSYQIGYEGVKAVAQFLQGQTVPKRIVTGVTLLTRETMNAPENKKLLTP